jgi:hypothetical protein
MRADEFTEAGYGPWVGLISSAQRSPMMSYGVTLVAAVHWCRKLFPHGTLHTWLVRRYDKALSYSPARGMQKVMPRQVHLDRVTLLAGDAATEDRSNLMPSKA